MLAPQFHSLVSVLVCLSIPISHVAALSLQPRGYTRDQPKCKYLPGDAGWPSDADWKALNTTLGGKLIKTVPIGSVCHTNQPFTPYDSGQCSTLQTAWNVPTTHTNSASSVTAPFFANQSCDPFAPTAGQCVIGSYVQYSVRATSSSDYQAAIKFATDKNVRLVIRNTAHDYLGKSTGTGALAIWTHDLKNIEFKDYKSVNYSGKAVKLGAGVQFNEVFPAAHAKGLVVVGGNCPTVGISGGYSQGGGHGLITSRVGLGADQILEWEVVNAAGTLVTATPTKNVDLYWALSGGGGGTYGVVLSLTVKAYADKKTTAATLSWTSDNITQDAYYDAVTVYIKNSLALVDAGSVGSFLLTGQTFSVAPVLNFGISKKDFDKLLKPVLDYLTEEGIAFSYSSQEYSTFLDAYTATNVDTGVGLFQLGGRLINRNQVAAGAGLVDAFRTINDNGGIVSGMSLNVGGKPHLPNAVHPAWRTAGISVVLGTIWDNTDWAANLANQKLMTEVLVPALDAIPNRITPPAAYMNEADFREPNWQSVFYGSNYGALLKVKTAYDPNGLFYARTAVGSEKWTEEAGGRLCRA